MGPEAAKSYRWAGAWCIRAPMAASPAERAKQEIDYGRRGKGYVFGAFQPATGEALTATTRRTTANFVDFLEQVDAWLPAETERVYVILDNLRRIAPQMYCCLPGPSALGVRLPAQVRRLSEPDRALVEGAALAGPERSALRDLGGACEAIQQATAYWNAHRHPFVWGRRRRHQPRRASGIGLLPKGGINLSDEPLRSANLPIPPLAPRRAQLSAPTETGPCAIACQGERARVRSIRPAHRGWVNYLADDTGKGRDVDELKYCLTDYTFKYRADVPTVLPWGEARHELTALRNEMVACQLVLEPDETCLVSLGQCAALALDPGAAAARGRGRAAGAGRAGLGRHGRGLPGGHRSPPTRATRPSRTRCCARNP